MRVLIDVNVYLSYLLNPAADSAVCQVVEAGIMGEFTLLVPNALWQELVEVVRRKPHLQRRISAEQIQELRAILEAVGEPLPEIDVAIPRVVRDPKDDYLLAHALLDNADYLVTGDADLLALDPVGDLRILSPHAFMAAWTQA